jgi:acyl-phosphate glycerol 3-phosphate acyltransferase
MLLLVLVCLGAYLVGGTPFGYLVARARGLDIFHEGSGNIGATNVGRVLGRRFGVLVFLLDFAKGAVPAAIARHLGMLVEADWGVVGPELLGVAGGLSAFLGHLFPVYLGFRGGKGVATGAGVVAVLLPLPFLVGLLAWLTVLVSWRYVSLASVVAAGMLCLVRLVVVAGPLLPENLPGTGFCFLTAGLVFWRHRSNLGRLLHGNENRLRNSFAMNTLTRALHLFALGIWLGSVVFFSFVVGPVLFAQFEAIGSNVNDRPSWFPLSREFARQDDRLDGPTEQGTRAAGEAVTPIFPLYFAIQTVCGLLALATAVGLAHSGPGMIHRLRVWILAIAFVTVLADWPLQQKVSGLREPRHQAVEAFLQSSTDKAEEARNKALQAKREFGLWHGFSLLLNLGTLMLVTGGMLLAARLPEASEGKAPPVEPKTLPLS